MKGLARFIREGAVPGGRPRSAREITRVSEGSRSTGAARVLLLLVLALALASCGSPPAVPERLAGLRRTHAVEGDEALAAIARLHGKAVRARDGFVAHYEGDAGVAMLYVTRAWLTPLATWQISRMADGIERGRANAEGRFVHLRAREQGDARSPRGDGQSKMS